MDRARAKAPVVTVGQRNEHTRSVADEPVIFGRLVAKREYRIGRQVVRLQVGTPHRASWKTAFYCPFRLTRGRSTTLHRTFGVDGIQALMLAFDKIKILLEELSPQISYFASERPGDVGIYRRVNGLGMDFDKQVGLIIEKAARARLRKLKAAHKRKTAKPPRAKRRVAHG